MGLLLARGNAVHLLCMSARVLFQHGGCVMFGGWISGETEHDILLESILN